MAITYVGSVSAGSTTATLPAHQAGDIILAFATRDGTAAAPGLGSGFTSITTATANTFGVIAAYRVATASGTAAGTWTNATGVSFAIYRPSAGSIVRVGANSAIGTGSSTTVTHQALTFQNTSGTSWGVRWAGAKITTSAIETAPSGYTIRQNLTTGDEHAIWDTNGTATGATSATQTIATSAWATITLELREYPTINGALASTEAGDTIASTGGKPILGDSSQTEADDTIVATGAAILPYPGGGTGWDTNYSYPGSTVLYSGMPTYSKTTDNNDTATGIWSFDHVCVISAASYSKGKYYVEVIGDDIGIYTDQHWSSGGYGAYVYHDGTVYITSEDGVSSSISGRQTFAQNIQIISLAVDFDNHVFWYRVAGGTWQGATNVGTDPATGVDGITFATGSTLSKKVAFGVTSGVGSGYSVKIITHDFTFTKPSGFTDWGDDSAEKTVYYPITADIDDGAVTYNSSTTGQTFYNTAIPGGYLGFGKETSTDWRYPFWRWNLPLDKNTTITGAGISSTWSWITNSGAPATIGVIAARPLDDAPAWAAGTNSPVGATKSTATSTIIDDPGVKYLPVGSMVQEIINRSGWANNNHIAFFGDPSGSTAPSASYLGDYSSGGTDRAAVLKVTYLVPATGITGTASITEAGDTVTSASTLKISGSASSTEAADTVVAPATLALKASLSSTEADDTVVTAAISTTRAAVSITEANDSLSSTAGAPPALWKPTSGFSAGVTLEGWYRSIDPDNIISAGADFYNGSAITDWTDRSGHSRTLVKEGTLSYNATGLGTGRPTVDSATSGAYRTATGMAYPSGVPVNAFTIVNADTSIGGSRIVSLIVSGGHDAYGTASGVAPIFNLDADNIGYFYGFSYSDVAVTANTPIMLEGYATDSSNAVASVNATAGSTAAAGINSPALDRLGFGTAAHGEGYMPIRMAELVLVFGVMTATDIETVEGYLAWNNGIQASLPSGHTYKSAPPTTTATPSGTAAITEADDTIASVSTIKISGILASTEASDTVASVSTIQIRGTESSSEADDIVSSVSTIKITGTTAATEAGDTVASVSTIQIKGTETTTEADDTVTATAISTTRAAVAITEADDLVSSVSTLAVKAVAAITEAGDATTSAAVTPIVGSVAITEAGDTIAATSVIPVKGTEVSTEADDIVASVATIKISGTLAATEADDSITSTGSLQALAGGTVSITEASDTIASVSTIQIKAALAVTEDFDTTASNSVLPVIGTLAVTEAGDTVAAVSTIKISGLVAANDNDDTVASVSVIKLAGSATVTEAGDTSAATGTTNITATVAITEAGDVAQASSSSDHYAAAAIVEASDTVAITGTTTLKASAAVTEADDTTTSAARISETGVLAVVEADDTLASVATVKIAGTETSVEENDTLLSASKILITAAVALQDDSDTVTAAGIFSTTATVSVTEDSDNIVSTSVIYIAANSNVVEDDDTCTSINTIPLFGTAALVEEDDIADIGAYVVTRATVSIIEENDTVSQKPKPPVPAIRIQTVQPENRLVVTVSEIRKVTPPQDMPRKVFTEGTINNVKVAI